MKILQSNKPPAKDPPTEPPRTFEGPPANRVLFEQEFGIEADIGDIVSPAATISEGDDDLPTVPLTDSEAVGDREVSERGPPLSAPQRQAKKTSRVVR